jgi:NADPH:quinone reductase-like Zn-dependent oxidoreductase
MRAVRIHSFGGPEVLTVDQVEVPALKLGEILVKVGAAGMNPVDYQIRRGGYHRVSEAQLPVTLGRDICGIVVASANSEICHTGDAVYALLDWNLGGYAEFAALPAALCAPKPASLPIMESAAVPLAALTAWQGIFDHGELQRGQTILIHGGSGGVGHFAIQFAKSRGAHVLATAAGGDADFVRHMGADVVIDYTAQRFEEIASEIDVVYDLVGGDTRERSWGTLRRGGILVSTLGQPEEANAQSHAVRAKGYVTQPNRDQLMKIARLIDAKRVRPAVHRTFPLEAARDAQIFLEESHPRGKVVLTVDDSS